MLSNLLYNYPRIEKLPDKLIYLRQSFNNMNPPQQEFVIFKPNSKKISGLMVCHKSNVQLRPDYNGPSLAIDYLCSFEQEKGFGKALITFAKNYSKRLGCDGHIFLKADGSFTPNRVPHLFYRKCGFSTLDKKKDKLLDKFIRKNRPANWKQFASDLMFYPAMKSKNSIFFDKLIKIFKRKI